VARQAEGGALDLMSERMFLAVALDDQTRHGIAAHLTNALDGRRLPGKTVPPQNWHLTLRFLGDTERAQAETLLAYLDEDLDVEPFRMYLAGLGGFPKQRKASVLWMGVAGDAEPLEALAAACEAAARRAGFEPEGRPFHPHLTLSRLRPPADVRNLVEEVPAAGIGVELRAVTLYRSIQSSGPVRYEVVDSVEL